MRLTVFYALCLIVLGMTGFIQWDSLESTGHPTGMLMPVFFGGAMLICVGFSREHFRHGLYGGLILAMLGIVSALIRIYQYEGFTSFSQAKTQIIAAMAVICVMQFLTSWSMAKKDRAIPPPR